MPMWWMPRGRPVCRRSSPSNPREGYTRVQALLAAATGQAAPAEVPLACEATGPYWLRLSEALTAPGAQGLVRNPLYVKARRGSTLRGTKSDPVDARLLAAILPRGQGPASHVPTADVPGPTWVPRSAPCSGGSSGVWLAPSQRAPPVAPLSVARRRARCWRPGPGQKSSPRGLQPGWPPCWRASRTATVGRRKPGRSQRQRRRASGANGLRIPWPLNGAGGCGRSGRWRDWWPS